MKKTLITLSLMVLFLGVVSVNAQKNDEPATLIKAAKFLEEKPFDKDAKKIRGWAITWVTETDKVSVKICSLLLSGTNDKYKYNPEILGQYTIGMAAFKLSNPDKANDENAAQLAGVESAVTSYQAMLTTEPKARNAFMDSLVTKRGDSSWATYVAENNCKGKKN